MAGALHTKEYRAVLDALVVLRRSRKVSQSELAGRLGRPPSFVAKAELCERRLDIVEWWYWIHALGEDPAAFLSKHITIISQKLPK